MDSYNTFLEQFKIAISQANRQIDEVELIAVSKKKSVEEIKSVIKFGQLSFGENQIQEVESKWINLKRDHPQIKLHFIGGIQSRKVKSIYQHCDVIHSIDRMKLVELFNKLENENQVAKDYFIQINIGDEAQKSGVKLSEADDFISKCIVNYNLNIIGLMCLPPLNEDPKKYFIKLKNMAQKYNFASLSMGMSSDYDVAIESGATHVRIGTQIFGPRN